MSQQERRQDGFDFATHLQRQREFSERTFGPGARTKGVIDHIRKELAEIEQTPDDLSEWADVVILGLDGFWRAGATPQQIIDALVAKQTKNESRQWPDWRTAKPDTAIEHVRDAAPEAERPRTPPAGVYAPQGGGTGERGPFDPPVLPLPQVFLAPAAPASVGGLMERLHELRDQAEQINKQELQRDPTFAALWRGKAIAYDVAINSLAALTPPPPSAEPPRWTQAQIQFELDGEELACGNKSSTVYAMLSYLLTTLPAPETDRRTE